MKRIAPLVLIVAIALLTIGALNFRNAGQPTSKVSGTFANSQVDTVRYKREGSESALQFWMHLNDSSKITSVIMRRVNRANGDSILSALVAGDTVTVADSSTSARLIEKTMNVAPLSEELWFFVTYAATKNGVTTPQVTYGLNKQYR